ncbi:MAG: hypothetical protein ACRDBG_04640 [Waterburya sp.]
MQAQIAALTGTVVAPPSDLDCSTNPNYPAATRGQTFYVTVAGRIGGTAGETVNVGDLIICKNNSASGDEATVGNNFFVVESNRDKTTETNLGLIQLATLAEVMAGLVADKAVTPAALQSKITDEFTTRFAGLQYSTTIGNGTDSVFTVTHNITRAGSRSVEVTDTVSGDYVMCSVTKVSNTAITLQFTNPPSNNQFLVTVS